MSEHSEEHSIGGRERKQKTTSGQPPEHRVLLSNTQQYNIAGSWALGTIRDFATYLKLNLVPYGPAQLLDASLFASQGHLFDKQILKDGLRCCFCKSPDQWRRFDKLFDSFFLSTGNRDDDIAAPSELAPLHDSKTDNGTLVGFAGTSSAETDTLQTGAGDFKTLSLADFRFVFNPAEKKIIDQLVEDLARRSKLAFLRRQVPHHRGSKLDMRRSINASMRYGGVLLQPRYLRTQKKLPKFLLLLDVSQSMEVYAKLFLRFTCKLVGVFKRSDVFAFNTELIYLGQGLEQLNENDLEQRINQQDQQWLGGTRIALSFRDFNENYASSHLDRQTTVVIFSDGCDTAGPEDLAMEVREIQAKCRKLLWVNPLLGRYHDGEKNPSMDPVTPFIDHYETAHNLESLRNLQRIFVS